MQFTPSQFEKHCYRIDERGYAAGEILQHGRWGRIIREVGETHPHIERESLLERIRIAEFPEKPSRLTGSFAFASFSDADSFHEQRWDLGSRQHMYEVVPVDPDAAYHVGYMLCLPPFEDHDPEAISRAYWAGERDAFGHDFSKESFVEIVFDCQLKIIRACHDPLPT